jgi:C-terminal processing protease CtpA/Prc
VDARFNGGGNDAVALRIMGSFTSERRLAFTKKAVEGAGFTDTQSVYFAPTVSTPFTGPVYYLQSGNTVSAAEIFTLAMMALPNATRIGTRTYGVLSDMLGKRLPNGWSFSLSNEIYLAVDGKLYEGLGIPPGVQIDTGRATDFRSRLQLDVEAALTQAGRAAH